MTSRPSGTNGSSLYSTPMATKIDLAALEKRHTDRLEPWVVRATELVAGKLADAWAHAEKAVTDTLRQTPDGRASLARIRANPSFQAALNRLDELHTAIAGPSVTSVQGLVHNAAEAFYHDARKYHWENWPKEHADLRVESHAVTHEQAAHVRGQLWFDLPVRQAFEVDLKRLKNSLTAALGNAGSTQATSRDGYLTLHTWYAQTVQSLTRRVAGALLDANIRADFQAMLDTIHPDWRPRER